MAKKIGILTLHGMGEQTPNFDHDLREHLNDRLSSQVRGDIAYKSIYYQDLVQPNQQSVWERMQTSDIDWMRLRKFFLYSFSDATTYQFRDDRPNSIYRQVNRRIRDRLGELEQDLESSNSPIVVIPHSLGCHVISNYIWDAQKNKGIWSDAFPPTEFQKLGTMKYMLTSGCNIPFFVSGVPNVETIDPPSADFRWINYYDKDDILGWPLKPLSNSYNAVVEDDIEINVGSWLSSWNPVSHTNYWTDRDFIRPVAQHITQLHAGL